MSSGDDGQQTIALKETILRDKNAQDALDRDGYIVLDLLSSEAVESFLTLYKETGGALPFVRGTHITTEHAPMPQRHRLSAQLMTLIGPHLGTALVDFKLLHGNFFVKEPMSKTNAIGFHRDWSFVDEQAGERSYTLWVALCDIMEESGGIGIVTGSHLKVSHLKHAVPKETYRFQEEVARLADAGPVHQIALRKGQAILWDHRAIHRSTENRGHAPRMCATFALTGKNNRLRLLWEEKDGFQWYHVPDDFYHLHNTSDLYAFHREGRMPEGASVVRDKKVRAELPLILNTTP
jgi:hypothetical protein